MLTSARRRSSLNWAWRALPVLLAASCGDSANGRADRPVSDGGDTLRCEADACDGLPVPEIACADGPTIVVCERGADGACRPQVRCESDEAGADHDGGSRQDAGPRQDAGSQQDAGGASDPGQACGGIAGRGCPSAQFCNYEVSAGGSGCQDISDASGMCQTIPFACTGLYDPVCGCDRHSYASACEAHAKGVAVLHQELCTVEECVSIGGRPEYSDGASTPSCKIGEQGFDIPGRERGICCVK